MLVDCRRHRGPGAERLVETASNIVERRVDRWLCGAQTGFRGNLQANRGGQHRGVGQTQIRFDGVAEAAVGVLVLGQRIGNCVAGRLGRENDAQPRAVEGAAFQTTAEAIADNKFAAKWVAAERGAVVGSDAPVIIGHSNGGFLGVQHVANHPETPALVLLSAHAGGKTNGNLAPKTGLLGGARTEEIFREAEEMVACFRRVLEIDPDHAAGQYHLAVGLLELGEVAAARAAVEKAAGLGHSPAPEFLKALERREKEAGDKPDTETGNDRSE